MLPVDFDTADCFARRLLNQRNVFETNCRWDRVAFSFAIRGSLFVSLNMEKIFHELHYYFGV